MFDSSRKSKTCNFWSWRGYLCSAAGRLNDFIKRFRVRGIVRDQWEVKIPSHWAQALCHRAFPAFGVRGGVNRYSCRKTTSCLARKNDLLKKYPFYFVLSLLIRNFAIKYRREASEEVPVWLLRKYKQAFALFGTLLNLPHSYKYKNRRISCKRLCVKHGRDLSGFWGLW